jgi:hypothetical protein
LRRAGAGRPFTVDRGGRTYLPVAIRHTDTALLVGAHRTNEVVVIVEATVLERSVVSTGGWRGRRFSELTSNRCRMPCSDTSVPRSFRERRLRTAAPLHMRGRLELGMSLLFRRCSRPGGFPYRITDLRLVTRTERALRLWRSPRRDERIIE